VIYGKNTSGKVEVAAKCLGEVIELRIGRHREPRVIYGSRGRTRIVTLEPTAAARLIAELGKAISAALAKRPA